MSYDKIKLSGSNGVIVFDVRPIVTESRAVITTDLSMPGPEAGTIATKNAPPSYSISGKFVSRTASEADKTIRDIYLLRSWTILSTEGSQTNKIVKFTGYGKGTRIFNNIPTVLTRLGITYDDSVDYIESASGAVVPIILSFNLSLTMNIQAAMESRFSRRAFLTGTLEGF